MEAKECAIKYLDAYPPEVTVHQSESWRFIDAYQKGLTGAAAAWVVWTQKSHRSVSEGAMKALEAHLKQTK